MTTVAERKLFSTEDYHKMAEAGIIKPSDRVELIEGEIIKMSPIRSPHAGMVNLLNRELMFLLGKQATICIQNPIEILPISEPESDLVIAKYRKDAYQKHHPIPGDVFLVIEVADSSLKYDRNFKQKLYAKANIPEYWIVNLQEQQVEVFRQPKGNKYKVREFYLSGDHIACSSIEFNLEVNEIFPEE